MASRPKKQSSSKLSSLAADVLNDPKASEREKALAGSVLSQDERPQKKRRRKDADEFADKPLDPDPRYAEIQKRCRDKTRDLKAGKVRGRARMGPTR